MRHKVTTDLLYPQLWRGCVGAWAPFLGPSGTTLRDSSGRNNHGTLTNMDAATDWVPSQSYYALDFDGSNDYVTIPSCPQSDQLTVCCWIRLAAVTNFVGFIAASDSSIGSNGYWMLGIGSATWRMSVRCPTSGLVHAAAAGAIATGQWFHVCGTFSGPQVAVHQNGVQLATGSTNATPMNTFATTTIGARTTASSFVAGLIDDVRIYNRALPQSEIALLARRRGIAYEAKRRSRGYVAAGGGNRRRRVLIGAG